VQQDLQWAGAVIQFKQVCWKHSYVMFVTHAGTLTGGPTVFTISLNAAVNKVTLKTDPCSTPC
jgi:hypothetical protein